MNKGRLEAFSDGVIAILITIMVLELKIPHGADLEAVRPLFPVFVTYILSFIYLGIYWNNHHHLLQATKHINGKILWANLHLLFWLSLVPFVTTAWMGENHFAPLPTAVYGAILFAAGIAYKILQNLIVAAQGERLRTHKSRHWQRHQRQNLTHNLRRRHRLWRSSTNGFPTHFTFLVALMWLIPDRRIESKINQD